MKRIPRSRLGRPIGVPMIALPRTAPEGRRKARKRKADQAAVHHQRLDLIAETARLHRQPHSSVGDKSYASWRGARGFLPLQVAGLAIRAGYWLPYQNETHRAVFGPSALDTCVAAARAGTSRSIALVPSHDDEYPLATTRDSTLMLELDGHDLIFWARLRDDHLGRARATADAVRAGRYCGVSILYTEEKSHRERQFGETIEVVDEARLLHIALVAPPARPAFHLSTIHILED